MDGITTTDTTSYVKVDEIYDSSSKRFNPDNFNKLVQYITGDTSTSASNMTAISTMATAKTNAATIRAKVVGDKTSSQDIIVRLGGLDWTVTYLSKDKNGNDILTLWLTNNEQDAWQTGDSNIKADAGEYYGFVLSSTTNKYGLYSDWASDWTSLTVKDGTAAYYPSNMYGTSYIRSVTLNNGGQYAKSNTVLVDDPGQDTNNVFAKFTMSSVKDSLTDYLVKPVDVTWQEKQSANAIINATYNNPNEEWNPGTSKGNYYSDAMNYAEHNGYDTWKNDYIWLPSMTETGYNGNSGTNAGLWQASIKQRQNYNGSIDSFSTTKIGSNNSNYPTTAYTYSWLRSGLSNYANYVFRLNPFGSDFNDRYVNSSCAVRPALHLNLKSASEQAVPPTWLDFADTSFENLNAGTEADPYIIDTPEKLAGISYRVLNKEQYSGKYFKQTENIDLNGLQWIPIGSDAGTVYRGNFDGNNYVVEGMLIDDDSLVLDVGLFGICFKGSIKNVILKNSSIYLPNAQASYVGGIVGESYSNADGKSIDNCVSYCNIYAPNSKYVGGITGYTQKIENCVNYGEVVGKEEVGGIVGGDDSGNTIKCYNNGKVKGNKFVGGISGGSVDLVSDCMNNGDIEGDTYVGGICGKTLMLIDSSSNIYLKKLINNGRVKGNDFVGLIIGRNSYAGASNAIKFENCFAGGYLDNKNSTGTNVGGIIGYADCASGIVQLINCSVNASTNGEPVDFVGNSNSYTGIITLESCYSKLGNKKVFSEGDFAGFGLVEEMNGGMPMQRELFFMAEFAPALDLSWFAENGFVKV